MSNKGVNMSEQSEQINELATALSRAQGKITGALKEASNPFFKSKYADLAACWDACRSQLSDNGLAVIQTTDLHEDGITVVTTLAHSSGQWIRGRLHMRPKDNSPQGLGSAITYARRYALAAIVGLAQVDDDGNAASRKPDNDPQVDQKEVNRFVSSLVDTLNADTDEEVRAEVIYNIRQDLNGKQDLMDAIWEQLETRQKRAIKLYIDQHGKKLAMTPMSATGK